MSPVLTSRRLIAAVAIGFVALAFWPALFGGGSLLSADIVATAPPFESYQPDGFSLENGPGDPINIHSHWAALADDVRSGDLSWWNPDLAGGQPTLKGGLPVFDLPYLVTPAWFAPGIVAAIRALAAIGLGAGFLRSVGLTRIAALAGGLAFGFSGFMVGWMNWPHSSVAALAPGLLWAIERGIRDPRPWRAIPIGVVAAAMVWANFPSVLIYVVLGAFVYAAIRAASEWRVRGDGRLVTRQLVVGVLALGIAGFFAAPHLIGFAEYVDWADTSQRIGNPDDSSAGVAYLMSAVAPAVWGSDAVGPAWFGEGNWVEFNAYVGASVLGLAVFGFVAAVSGSDRRRRSVAFALISVTALGVLIAYVGGPLGVLLGDLTGSRGGLMTRAKILWSIGIALGAGLGVDRLVVGDASTDGTTLRREVIITTATLCAALLVLAPSVWDWLDIVRRGGILRETVAASAAPIFAFVATASLIVARAAKRISAPAVGWSLVAVIGFELLSFAMPVPTIVDRDERLRATPAHDEVAALLGPGERLAGEGRTFFPSTTQLFDIADARGQLLKAPGYQALLRAVDADMLTQVGGGTATYPNIARGTDPTSPVWDVMGVGVWAQFPDSIPYGTRDDPALVPDDADPAVQPLRGRTVVPEGGLRAVLVRVVPLVGGFVDVSVTTDDGTTVETRWVEPSELGVMGFAVLGEHLRVGSEVTVEITAPDSTMFVAVDEQGAVPVGTVAGDDDLELVRVGDVILLDRPVQPVRLVDAVIVQPDPARAAAEISQRTTDLVAVVDRESGLPAVSDPTARLEVVSVEDTADRVTARVDTDRGALLVVSRAYYPGWTAKVDGVRTDVVIAEGAFLGVPVGPGPHQVELIFRPRHLGLSLISLLAGLVLVAVLVIHTRRGGAVRSSRASAG
jgi:Bacterial membrane protein YfhO